VTLEATIGVAADPAVLNVQLESSGKLYRDYFVDVRPGRTTTLVDFVESAPRLLESFRPAYANYAFKAALYSFAFDQVVAINLRWMRAPAAGSEVRVVAIEPLVESDGRVERPALFVGAQRWVLPATLTPGEAVEVDALGRGRVFDASGAERGRFESAPLPAWTSRTLRLDAPPRSRARVSATFPSTSKESRDVRPRESRT